MECLVGFLRCGPCDDERVGILEHRRELLRARSIVLDDQRNRITTNCRRADVQHANQDDRRQHRCRYRGWLAQPDADVLANDRHDGQHFGLHCVALDLSVVALTSTMTTAKPSSTTTLVVKLKGVVSKPWKAC